MRVPVPEASVLVGQVNKLTGGVGARRAASFGEQHQR
jgi:hypothetical protein